MLSVASLFDLSSLKQTLPLCRVEGEGVTYRGCSGGGALIEGD